MKPHVKRFLFWAPRILCLLFAAFLATFALDVFGEPYGLGEKLAALAIHLIPTAIVLLVLALSWRHEWLGALALGALALLYLSQNLEHVAWVVVISGPLLVTATLFLLGWVYRAQLRPGS